MLAFIIAIISISYAYITALNTQCDKIQCSQGFNPENKVCTSIKTDSEVVFYNNVTIYDVCNDNEVCDVNYFSYLADSLEDKDFTCSPKDPVQRYPGEDCTTDDDCLNDPYNPDPILGHCGIDKKCTGKKLNESCDYDDFKCSVGSYCENHEGICQPQKGFGESCDEDFACDNGLLCYNHTCSVKPFSLPVGTPLPVGESNEEIKSKFCNFGIFTLNSNITEFFCGMLNQTSSDEFVKCDHEVPCNYTLSAFQTYQLSCDCGLNADAQGYCQQGQNLSKILNLTVRGAGMAGFLCRAW
jgi:hypothetical protein